MVIILGGAGVDLHHLLVTGVSMEGFSFYPRFCDSSLLNIISVITFICCPVQEVSDVDTFINIPLMIGCVDACLYLLGLVFIQYMPLIGDWRCHFGAVGESSATHGRGLIGKLQFLYDQFPYFCESNLTLPLTSSVARNLVSRLCKEGRWKCSCSSSSP